MHEEFLVATLLSNNGLKLQARFDMRLNGLQSFRNWIEENGCQKLAVESTANLWYPLYNVLDGDVDFILTNAYHIKLSTVLSDIFGKSGRHIIEGLLNE